MATALAVPVFVASLGLTLLAARQLARRLDKLGVRFGFPEALIGMLTAVAADGPEIASALVALAKGDQGVSVGVLVGSGAFNLVAMLGLSALLAGAVMIGRAVLALEAAVALLIAMIAAAVLLRWLAVPVAVGLSGCAVAGYLAAVIGGYELMERAPLPAAVTDRLGRALASRPGHRSVAGESAENPAHHLLGAIVTDLALIIGGSFGMVQAAVALGDRWGVSQAALGVLILAPLTSIPNAFTGVRLGLAGRGAALAGEAFNSNTINLTGGVIVPAMFTPVVALTATAKLQLAWLIGMTVVSVGLLAARGGLRRAGGGILIALYAGFVATQLV